MNNNSYPNAASGMNKVFIAEILEIIAVIPLAVAVIITAVAVATGMASLADSSISDVAVGTLIGAGVSFGIYGIISLVGFILQIVGLNSAGKDHVYFKYAFGLVIIGILLTIGSSIFGANPVVSSLFSTGAECVDVIVMIFVVYGCMVLLDEKGNAEMVYSGYNVVNTMIFVNILSVFARLLPTFFVGGILDTIFMGFYIALTVVSGLMYLIFLKKASKALA